MTKRKLDPRELRQMRIIFSLIAAFLIALGVVAIVTQHDAGTARYPYRRVSFEGARAVQAGVGQIGFGLAMLFPWLGRRPALAVTYFGLMLVASIGVWIFGGALFR